MLPLLRRSSSEISEECTLLYDRGNVKSKSLNSKLPTTLVRLQSSHYVPSSSLETDQISQLLAEAQDHLARYDDEIDRLDIFTFKLNREHVKLQRYIDICHASIAPIRKLPAELLGAIFEWSAACSEHCDWQTHCHKITHPVGLTPWNIALVCSSWRGIALSLERLWCDFSMDLDNDLGDPACAVAKTTRIINILETYLKRSGKRHLTLNITAITNYYLRHPILVVVARSCPRLYRGDLWLHESYLLQDRGLIQAVQGNLPELARLDINVGDEWSNMPIRTRVFATCPKLRVLRLSASNNLSSPLPWDQITTLEVREHEAGDIFTYLGLCPQLADLIISDIVGSSSCGRSVTCSKLLALSLHFSKWQGPKWNCMFNFLDAVTLPRLKMLTLIAAQPIYDPEDIWPQIQLTSLLCRSSCPLEILNLQHVTMAAIQLQHILPLLSTLTTLRISNINIPFGPLVNNDLLRSLAYHPLLGPSSETTATRPTFLPRLTHLALSGWTSFDYDVLLDMLESRWSPTTTARNPIASLIHVEVSNRDDILDPAVLVRLRKLGAAGLEVVLDVPWEDIIFLQSSWTGF